MTKLLDVFCEIPCLTEQSKLLGGVALQKKWFKSADKRYIGQYLQKFIEYNSEQFKFLGVQPYIIGSDQSIALAFRSTGLIGCIPLRSSDTGKQIGDFVVMPRFGGGDRFAEYIEILNLLDTEINPEFIHSLPLASGKNFRPPLYLEAAKFIVVLEKLTLRSWRIFDNVEDLSNVPIGQINWTKYINQEYKVENRLSFPTRRNVLSELHIEYAEIRYVFDLCKAELLSANTPHRVKNSLLNKLNFLDARLYLHKPKSTNNISIRSSDSPIVRSCKAQANKILNFNLAESTAWRVDFSDVFEKLTQHIFKEVASKIGGKVYSNFKFHSKTSRQYAWELNHIEPDAIFQKEKSLIFIDAKYKSNLYNKFAKSDELKDDHRRDLHQIMAYSSFSNSDSKFSYLCYPAERIEVKYIQYKNKINEVTNNIGILGIPLRKDAIKEVEKLLIHDLSGFIGDEKLSC